MGAQSLGGSGVPSRLEVNQSGGAGVCLPGFRQGRMQPKPEPDDDRRGAQRPRPILLLSILLIVLGLAAAILLALAAP